MYATIRHCERGAESTDDLAQAGHALANRLNQAPGFVACLLLETLDGGCAAVYIFEDPASLEAARAQIGGWTATGCPAIRAELTGEVIAQKGL